MLSLFLTNKRLLMQIIRNNYIYILTEHLSQQGYQDWKNKWYAHRKEIRGNCSLKYYAICSYLLLVLPMAGFCSQNQTEKPWCYWNCRSTGHPANRNNSINSELDLAFWGCKWQIATIWFAHAHIAFNDLYLKLSPAMYHFHINLKLMFGCRDVVPDGQDN